MARSGIGRDCRALILEDLEGTIRFELIQAGDQFVDATLMTVIAEFNRLDDADLVRQYAKFWSDRGGSL